MKTLPDPQPPIDNTPPAGGAALVKQLRAYARTADYSFPETVAENAAGEIERLSSLLITVLPYMEQAEFDPSYKPGAVRRIVNMIKDATKGY